MSLENSIFFDTATLEEWLKEDVGYFDLTSHILGLHSNKARITWVARHEMVAACIEEAVRLLEQQGAKIESYKASGSLVQAGESILTATGPTQALLNCWKVVQNIFEYTCAVAHRALKMRQSIDDVNPSVGLFTTRKHPPGLRRLVQKAVLSVDVYPHRLGLSETVLIFSQHRSLLEGGWAELKELINKQRKHLVEKKIIIEVESLEEAIKAIDCGADALQFDKIGADELKSIVDELQASGILKEGMTLLAAGGIRQDNAADYATTGVHGLVTSSIYFGPPADVGVKLERF